MDWLVDEFDNCVFLLLGIEVFFEWIFLDCVVFGGKGLSFFFKVH